MTVFGMESVAYQSPDRRWLADDHGTEIMPGVPLDLTLFDSTQHYANGYIADGILLGKVTASGKYGPYISTASDGRQTVAGIMFNDVAVYATGTATLRTNVTVPLFLHGFVNEAFLPYTSSNAALGGFLDSGARTALKNIIFLASGLQA